MYKFFGFLIMALAIASCREQPVTNQMVSPPSVSLDSISSGTSHILWSISFPSADTGYVVGDSGTLVRTYNGGSSWNFSTIEASPLWSVFFWSDTEGLVGGSGFILHSRNSLASWDSLRSSDVHSLGGVPNGWLLAGTYSPAGGNYLSMVFASSDTGRSWNPVVGTFQSVPVAGLAEQGGHFIAASPQIGPSAWFPGGGSISVSTSPDSSWQSTYSGGSWAGVAMDASGNAVAVGDSGHTLWSTDYGQTWTSVSSGITSILRGVAISSTGNIVAVGDSAIFTSSVGSQSWAKLSTPAYPLTAVTFASSTEAIAVGMDGKIYTVTFSSP